MTFLQINRNLRSIRRYRNIIRVLFKYGFDNLLEYLNLAQFVARSRRILHRETSRIAQLSPAERMRLALEELGPTFIKLGQLLSTRPDVIPEPYVAEFCRLQDNVPSFPEEAVREQIVLELGAEIEAVYCDFDPTPLAAASIAQVHRARLTTGEEVAVKVRRPGVVELVEADIDVLMGLALLAERHFPASDSYDPVGLVREFARTIRREMDFTREGRTIERMAANFAGDVTLHFPRVYWDRSSKGVLTLEYVDGIKVNDLALLQRAGMDPRVIAKNGADAFLKMVLQHGFFHGDPHPGNVFILPRNVVCFLDYGMVGRLDEEMKNYLVNILLAIIERDVDRIIALVSAKDDLPEAGDRVSLKRDLTEFIDCYYELQLRDIAVGRMLTEFFEIITVYRIRFQPDLMLLAKALVSIEGMGRDLDPQFNMVEHLRPFMEQAIRDRHSPGRMARDAGEHTMALLQMAKDFPGDLKELLQRINRNKFRIDLEHRGLDFFVRELDKSVNRLSFSLIIAALIVGSSLIMQTNKGPLLFGFPVFAFLGYSIAGLIGLWWVIAILRSGRL